MLKLEWDEPSALWLRDLPRFAESLVSGMVVAVDDTLRHALQEALPVVPVFERDLRDDLNYTMFPRPSGAGKVAGAIGFSGNTLIDEIENNGEATQGQFSVARGMDTGIRPHEVYLYNWKTGKTTDARAKLIRYLKKKNASVYGDMPERPDKEWFQKRGNYPLRKVLVIPFHANFLDQLIWQNGDPLASFLVERVYEAVGRQWAGTG